ncbi:hypothetical protein ANN_27569 [Periplaneta americana]|uniref:Uncharacterized protein n=1 Tax=Periplaneta americana TaxID=6978 RepID=A0ABQ8RWA6_PERAM|nr:hypothetical protein ANN_27569 [Periplaneta americana]
MDLIKMEPEFDPLDLQAHDTKYEIGDNEASSEEGNLSQLEVTGMKTECMDHSYEIKSEIKVEDTPVPISFSVVKSEVDEDFVDLDRVQQEQKVQVSSEEEDEVFPDRLMKGQRNRQTYGRTDGHMDGRTEECRGQTDRRTDREVLDRPNRQIDSNISPADPGRGRKRTRNEDNWKRNISKKERYAASSLPHYPSCEHRKAKSSFQCHSLTMKDIKSFHHTFYLNKDKIGQDTFIMKYCVSTLPKRRKYDRTQKARSVSTKYYIVSETNKRMVPVCRDAFLGVLRIGKDRVARIMRQCTSSSSMPRENRGGDRVSHKNEAKRAGVKTFIESLNCSTGHYCRSKTAQRFYLPSELNIKKLWHMYNGKADVTMRVKQCFFRQVFNTFYNIGFGSPATDICSVSL